MKYYITIIAVITLISAGLVMNLYLNPGFLTQSMPINQVGSPANSLSEVKDLTPALNILQDDVATLKNILDQQSLLVGKLKEGSSSDGARITGLEKKVQELRALLENKDRLNASDIQPQPQDSASESPNLNFSPELFNDTEFAKLFQDKVEEVMKNVQQKQRDEQMKRFSEQMQESIARRIDEFAKTQNLNDYQKGELNKLISDRVNKSTELFNKMRLPDR